jgi:hypothetical protein
MRALLFAISALTFPQQTAPPVDSEAARVLGEMVKAYRSAGKFRQETVYGAGEGKTPRLLRSSLVISRPNRIVLEMIQPAVDRQKPYRLLYHSDGKDMYAYQETKGFYAKEKAPKNLKELDYLAVSIEAAAILGGDPIAPLLAQARSVKMEAPQLVDAVLCDVVLFDMATPQRTVSLRLSVGQKDRLLRKFDYSAIPVPKPEPEQPKDRIVVGDPSQPPPPEQKPDEPVYLSYENHVYLDRDLPKDVFKWVAPTGSFQYQDYPSVLNPTGGTSAAVAGTTVVPPNGQKPMKITPFEEIMKKAWKKKRR